MKLLKIHQLTQQTNHPSLIKHHPQYLIQTIINPSYAHLTFIHIKTTKPLSYQLQVKNSTITQIIIKNLIIFALNKNKLIGMLKIEELMKGKYNKVMLKMIDVKINEKMSERLMRQADWNYVVLKQLDDGLFWCEYKSNQLKIIKIINSNQIQQIKIIKLSDIIIANQNNLVIPTTTTSQLPIQITGLYLDKRNLNRQQDDYLWLTKCTNINCNKLTTSYIFLCSLIKKQIRSQPINIINQSFHPTDNLHIISDKQLNIIIISTSTIITVWSKSSWQLQTIIPTTAILIDIEYLSHLHCFISCEIIDHVCLLIQYDLKRMSELAKLEGTILQCLHHQTASFHHKNLSLFNKGYTQQSHHHCFQFITSLLSQHNLLVQYRQSIYILISPFYSLTSLLFKGLTYPQQQNIRQSIYSKKNIYECMQMRWIQEKVFYNDLNKGRQFIKNMVKQMWDVEEISKGLQEYDDRLEDMGIIFNKQYMAIQILKQWMLIFIYLSQWVQQSRSQFQSHTPQPYNYNIQSMIYKLQLILNQPTKMQIDVDQNIKIINIGLNKMKKIVKNVLFVVNKINKRSQQILEQIVDWRSIFKVVYNRNYLCQQYLTKIVKYYRHNQISKYQQYRSYLQQLVSYNYQSLNSCSPDSLSSYSHKYQYPPLVYSLANLPQYQQIVKIHVNRIKQRIGQWSEESKIGLQMFGEQCISVVDYIKNQGIQNIYCFSLKAKPKTIQQYLDFTLRLTNINAQTIILTETQALNMLFSMQKKLSSKFLSSNFTIDTELSIIDKQIILINNIFIKTLQKQYLKIYNLQTYNLKIDYNCKWISNQEYKMIKFGSRDYQMKSKRDKKMIRYYKSQVKIQLVVGQYFKSLYNLTSDNRFQNVKAILQIVDFQSFIHQSHPQPYNYQPFQNIQQSLLTIKQTNSILQYSDREINYAKILSIQLWNLFDQLHQIQNNRFEIYQYLQNTQFIHNFLYLQHQLINIMNPQGIQGVEGKEIGNGVIADRHYYGIGFVKRVRQCQNVLQGYEQFLESLKLKDKTIPSVKQYKINNYYQYLKLNIQLIQHLQELKWSWLLDFQDIIQYILLYYQNNVGQEINHMRRLINIIKTFVIYYQT